MSQIKNLLIYLENSNDKISKDIAFSILKYSKNSEIVKMANNLIKDEVLEVDLWELESLVNPDSFKYKNIKVDTIGIKNV